MDALIDHWKRDEAAVFEGWDFSYLDGRASQDDPPWSYEQRARTLLGGAGRLLDVDTGGGEALARLGPLPPLVRAIESYPPNVAVARQRLSGLGVTVDEVAVGAPWPFEDGAFDLILNRQGHLNIAEIARTLSAGGTLLTQQVGSDNLADLAALFGVTAPSHANILPTITREFQRAGLEIAHSATWSGRQSFADVGAVVYFLRAVPWVVPAFSVDRHGGVLRRLQGQLESGGALSFTITRFLVEANKAVDQ